MGASFGLVLGSTTRDGNMGLFGEPLEAVMAQPDEEKVPKVVKQTLGILNGKVDLEGLFRVSAGVKDLENLKARFDAGEPVDLSQCDPHLVAGLLKAFLIELPEPLLTFGLYDEFIEAADTPDCKERLKATFQKLPPVNKLTAGCLFYFLSRVASCEDQSKMATNNLAIVFGQILLRPQVESLVSLLRHSPKITSLLKCLIENYAETVPADEAEAELIVSLISSAPSNRGGAKLSREQQKLRNIKSTVDDSIQIVLDRLDEMSRELSSTTSLEETIEIAKRVRTAKRYLFSEKENEAA